MTTRTMLIPGAETPEGQARIQREVDARNDIDFRAYRILAELRESRLLNYDSILNQMIDDGESSAEAEDYTRELLDQIDQLIRDRRMADHYVLQALAGRPDPREG